MTNLVYFGSPAFSAQILDSLLAIRGVARPPAYAVCGVVTSPDKPLGRKQVLTPSPVAQLAAKYDLPIFKPERLDEANLAHLKLLKPDIFVVVSYGKIIPKTWLATTTIGTFNLHFSLLPKYRGALCISEAIKNQDSQTGVTLMTMDEGMDTGPIISQEKVSIDINDNCETLTKKLTQSAIKLLAEYLPQISSLTSPSSPSPYQGEGRGEVLLIPQDNALATYTPTTKTRNRQSAFIPWSQIQKALDGEGGSATHALIRSLNPDPGAWTQIPVFSSQSSAPSGIEVKIIKTSLKCHSGLACPEYFLGNPGSIQIDSGSGAGMTIELVQLPGKTPISWKQFKTRTNLAKNPI